MQTNVMSSLFLTALVSFAAVSARGDDATTAPQSPPRSSRAQAIPKGQEPSSVKTPILASRPASSQPGFTLEDYTTHKDSLSDVGREFGSVCQSVGTLCGSALGFLARHKLILPLAIVGIALVAAVRAAARIVFRSK